MDNQATQTTPEFYNIDVEVKQIKGTRDDGSKYDFLVYEGIDKRGKVCKIKFRKDLTPQLPKTPGDYVLTVDKRHIARDKKSKYLVYWVRQIISFEEKIFEDVDNTEDLPF